ncbi:cytochrome P450 [Actinophytocola xinjiangensis]|nr:cytochrome P450 [Actinophytocola xinjiangensis]
MPRRGMDRMRRRYGDTFTVNIPVFGRAVVLSDPVDIKRLFTAGPDEVDNLEQNLGRVLGPGSLFALAGEEHKRRRRLLVPPFNGKRLAAYERIVEEETVRELASWPTGEPFPVLPSTMRITLNVILRTVFGAQGREYDQLLVLLPKLISLGSHLSVVPVPKIDVGGWTPWGRFWSMRRAYDVIIDRLIDIAEKSDLDERGDVLAMLVQSRYEDGDQMSRTDIADQLLTLLAAGHETTATTLAWAVERLRRHPTVLADLVDEVDAGGKTLREATVLEVQRNRPSIDVVGRQVKAERFEIGRWSVPRGYSIVVGISLIHDDEAIFPNPHTFDPSRFVNARPDLYRWIPFGGGNRRCIGAAFATMEMNVVLRTILRDRTLVPTSEPAERWRSRGIANAPGRGGLAVVRPR